MSSPCPYCPNHTEFRNQRFAGHLYNNHKKQLLEENESKIKNHIQMKKPYVRLTYKINDEQIEKWFCFASGVSCVSLKWMLKHNENHKALGAAHLQMMQQLIADKEKIMTAEDPKATGDNKELLARIKQLEAENKVLKADRDEWKETAETYQRESTYMCASIKIYNELLENFYRRDGFADMYKAVEGYMNLAYDSDNYNKETEEYSEEAIKEGEENARSVKYDYEMYLGERPKSKEAILEEFCYDNDLELSNYRY